MKIGDLLRTKQENLFHLVALHMGQHSKCKDPSMVQIKIFWSDGATTVEFRDNFEVISESR